MPTIPCAESGSTDREPNLAAISRRGFRSGVRLAGWRPDTDDYFKERTVTETTRLAPGDKAPAFSLPDADGNKVSLSDFKGRRVVVYFYPAASTPGCTKQACDFRDSLAELNDAGLDVVGISPTSRRSWRNSVMPRS